MKRQWLVMAAMVTAGAGLCLPHGAWAQGARPAAAAAVDGPEIVDRICEGVVSRLNDAVDEHWHKGDYNHIVNLYRVIISAQPYYTEAYANAGWLLWSMDRDAEAVALYEAGAKANPDTFSLYDELGFYFANRKKDWARAVTYYERAAAAHDVQPISIHMLAHAYEKTGQLSKAEKTWTRAVEMPGNPNAPAARVNLERVRRLMAGQK